MPWGWYNYTVHGVVLKKSESPHPLAREGAVGANGHRHGHRSRSLQGSFGQVEIEVPRARLSTPTTRRNDRRDVEDPAERTQAARKAERHAFEAGYGPPRTSRATSAGQSLRRRTARALTSSSSRRRSPDADDEAEAIRPGLARTVLFWATPIPARLLLRIVGTLSLAARRFLALARSQRQPFQNISRPDEALRLCRP
jgi:hypothetical protein